MINKGGGDSERSPLKESKQADTERDEEKFAHAGTLLDEASEDAL